MNKQSFGMHRQEHKYRNKSQRLCLTLDINKNKKENALCHYTFFLHILKLIITLDNNLRFFFISIL